jgi:hypothetical protein
MSECANIRNQRETASRAGPCDEKLERVRPAKDQLGDINLPALRV